MKNGEKRYWVVVLVESGVPVNAEIFQNFDQAQAFEKTLRSQICSDNDEVGIFEAPIRIM